MQKRKIKMAVIFYGDKGQHKINQQQFEYLRKMLTDFVVQKYDFNFGEHNKLLREFKQGKIDVVLKNSFGRGHEAVLESWLELNQIPFLGSDSVSTFVATDKFLSKQIFLAHGIPAAKDVFVNKLIWNHNKAAVMRQIKREIHFPCIIKDTAGTDSRGIYIAKNLEQCEIIIKQSIAKHESIIVEEYIGNAYEVTCFVTGNGKPRAYEPVGLEKGGALLSGAQKDNMKFTPMIPIDLPKNTIEKIKQYAVLAHQALRCRTFSRADFLIKDRRSYILEVDVHPGFRHKSATTLSAQYAGQNLNELFLMFCKKYVRTPAIR